MPYSRLFLASEDGKKKRSQINKKYREQLRACRIGVAREYGVNPIIIQLGTF